MKKLMVLSMAFLFSISLVFGQTKEKVKVLIEAEQKIEEEIKETKKDLKEEEKELKVVKKEMKMLEGSNVNKGVKDAFYDDFGNITDVVWEKSDLYDVATFTKDGNLTKAYYNFESQLIGTTSYVLFTYLPEIGQKRIKEKYADYEIGKVIFYDDNESVDIDFFIFESQFKHEDNFFVELTKESSHIILKVGTEGDVHFFKNIE